jgi:arylsulfatase A-like enzyme
VTENSRTWNAVAAGVLLIVTAACAAPELSYESPPILIVDIDTLRADHLGCYGYHRPTSPHIDRFAADAIRFEWVFAQAPNTPPSQASILTGLYPTSHGRIGDKQVIDDGAPALAVELSRAGYRTDAYVDGGLMVSGYGYERGFDSYDDEAGHLREIGPKVFDHLGALVDDARSGDHRPWFLLVHTYDVHSPYEISPSPYDRFFFDQLGEMPDKDYRSRMSEVMAGVWKARNEPNPPRLSDAEMAYAVACYDGGIRHVDEWFGKLVRWLRRSGLYDRCIIVVISDHGDEFQEHGGLFHERIYATVARIPLIIRFPGGRHAGLVVDQIAESIDLMPTLLREVGLSIPQAVQGRDLAPLIDGVTADGRVAVTESPYYGRRIAAADERARLIISEKAGTAELYDYRADIHELVDRAAADPVTTIELQRAIDAWRARIDEFVAIPEQGPEFDAEQLEQLKKLGYVE